MDLALQQDQKKRARMMVDIVSILVVMDLALQHAWRGASPENLNVSILVVMDLALQQP